MSDLLSFKHTKNSFEVRCDGMRQIKHTISSNNTLPSFVNLICPAPLTNILIVPRGPKLLFNTFCNPLPALIFIASVLALPITSAFGLTVCTALILGAERRSDNNEMKRVKKVRHAANSTFD